MFTDFERSSPDCFKKSLDDVSLIGGENRSKFLRLNSQDESCPSLYSTECLNMPLKQVIKVLMSYNNKIYTAYLEATRIHFF